MSNGKDQLSELINQLSRGTSGNLSISTFTQPLVSAINDRSTAANLPASASSGLKTLSVGTSESLKSIQFGKPSSTASNSSAGSNGWSKLLSSAASGGLASALSGGLSSIAGLGGLISDITSFFGGSSKAAPPPLALFSLPNSIQQTAYVSSKGTTVYSGDSVEQSSNSSTSAIYTTNGIVSNAGRTSAPATDSTAIAQAVKNALLTSNTLGDVIAEI